jgi:glycosyltransferase involved in cell wall biosynthesis
MSESTLTPAVVIVTDVDFWYLGAGHRQRIRALAAFLSRHTALTMIILRPVSDPELELLRALALNMRYVILAAEGDADPALYRRRLGAFLANNPCDVCIIEYLHLSYVRDVIPEGVKVLLDTHDLISDRSNSFQHYQAPHQEPDMTPAQEYAVFDRYDAVILISDHDYQKTRHVLGDHKTVLAPHPTQLPRQAIRPTVGTIGYLASEYLPNVDAIAWFVNNVWPGLQGSGVQLDIYGNVCRKLRNGGVPGLKLRGFVASHAAVYAGMDIVINPVRFGAGLKIKNVEALGSGLPLVTSSHGAQGLPGAAGHAFLVADTPEEYLSQLTLLIRDHDYRSSLADAAYRYAQTHFSPETCFSSLLAEIRRHGRDRDRAVR